jgi:hypothetical protein
VESDERSQFEPKRVAWHRRTTPHKIFNYILRLLYLGCQWKEPPIEKDGEGRPEIHYTRIYNKWGLVQMRVTREARLTLAERMMAR